MLAGLSVFTWIWAKTGGKAEVSRGGRHQEHAAPAHVQKASCSEVVASAYQTFIFSFHVWEPHLGANYPNSFMLPESPRDESVLGFAGSQRPTRVVAPVA